MNNNLHPITRNVLNRIAPVLPTRDKVTRDKIATHIEINKEGGVVKVEFEWSDLGWVLLNPLIINKGGDGTFEMGCSKCNEKVTYKINKDRNRVKAIGSDNIVDLKLW